MKDGTMKAGVVIIIRQTPETAGLIQPMLFEQGYTWRRGHAKVDNRKARVLVVRCTNKVISFVPEVSRVELGERIEELREEYQTVVYIENPMDIFKAYEAVKHYTWQRAPEP